MDKKYIEDNEIEIKYLRNQLEGEELEGFEVYLMENPELIEFIQLEEKLDRYVEDPKRRTLFDRVIRKFPAYPKTGRLIENLSSGLLGAALVFAIIHFSTTDQQWQIYNAQLQPLTITRGNAELENRGPIFTFDSVNLRANFILLIDTGFRGKNTYHISISKLDESYEVAGFGKSATVVSDSGGRLFISLPAYEFTEGNYRVQLNSQGQEVSEYFFSTQVSLGSTDPRQKEG